MCLCVVCYFMFVVAGCCRWCCCVSHSAIVRRTFEPLIVSLARKRARRNRGGGLYDQVHCSSTRPCHVPGQAASFATLLDIILIVPRPTGQDTLLRCATAAPYCLRTSPLRRCSTAAIVALHMRDCCIDAATTSKDRDDPVYVCSTPIDVAAVAATIFCCFRSHRFDPRVFLFFFSGAEPP